ncbi:TetR/AcrR family transcriptional regulator [Paenibacillus filicis]|uniref:TetR/AcrR family transcriptional regulator n=1 Tax=Paenibacillus filicis TaxID=669464 RepID=A0ABU9DMC3_9BACL
MANEQALTKALILDTAEQVFRRFGPDKTSVVDIAKVLQVSHGTLYRHFASKAALREAVTERWLNVSIAQPLQEIADRTDVQATERLRIWFDALISAKRKYALEDPEMFAMYTAVTLDAAEMIQFHVQGLIQQIAGIIEEGIQAQELKAGSPGAIANGIFMATSRFHHPAHASEWRVQAVDTDFADVWHVLLGGIQL